MMEYIDTGVPEQAIGISTEEERQELKESYVLMSSHIDKKPDESFEIWLKKLN